MALLTYGSCYVSTAVITSLAAATPQKAAGTTTAMKLAGFTSPVSNRLTYTDATTRDFEIMFTGSCFKGGGGDAQLEILLHHGVSAIPGAVTLRTIASATDNGAFAVSAQVTLAQNEYVELWLKSNTINDITISQGVLSAKVLG